MTEGFGSINFWGFSPALDLQAVIDKKESADVTSQLKHLDLNAKCHKTVRILLVGSGDCRHVLQTMARRYRRSPVAIEFFIIENNLELYARQLVLLTLCLEKRHNMGLQDKTEFYLELFGNSLIRQQCLDYLERKCVTDLKYFKRVLPLFDLSNLKFKERDFLEAIFKFWRKKDTAATFFDIEKCWDLRLRHHLGDRFDAVPNVFDWDYSMHLCEKDAKIVNSRKYSWWRQTGIAFQIREGDYVKPNKTLASGRIFSTSEAKVSRRGYWGDIVVSPFISHGIQSEKKDFFKTSNDTLLHTSENVSEYNIMSLLHELETDSPYVEDKKPSGATLSEITEEEEETEGLAQEEARTLENDYIALSNASVTFLPLSSAESLWKKEKFKASFDIVLLSNSMVHHLNKDFASTFADKAKVILETSRYMLELSKEHHEAFTEKVTAIAKGVGCQIAEEDSNFLYCDYQR